MRTALAPTSDTDRFTAASWPHRLVPELVALTLDAKQSQWNVTGPMFPPLHSLTDEVADDTRAWKDRIGERALALGFAVDACASAVPVAKLPAGYLTDRAVLDEYRSSSAHSPPVAQRPRNRRLRRPRHHFRGPRQYRWMLPAQWA